MNLSLSHNISLIMPAHRDDQEFRRARQALQQLQPAPFEIIIVLDGSRLKLQEEIEKEGFTCIRLPLSCGAATARNTGAQQAQGEWLFFVDADVELATNALSVLNKGIIKHPQSKAFFGSYDDQPGVQNFFSQYKNLTHHFTHQQAREEAFTFWSGCGAIKKQVFAELKGFDENFKASSIEDIELGYRIKKAGYSIRLLKNLQGTHLKKWTFANLLHTEIFARARPWSKIIWQSKSLVNDLNISWSARVKTALVFIQCLMLVSLWFGAGKNAGIIIGTAGISWFFMEWQLFNFFSRKKGRRFAVKALAWQWFYYLYSGLTFIAVGFYENFIANRRPASL